MSVSEEKAWKALITAAQNFVDKVDSGKAHSVKSYEEFKTALALVKEIYQ